jgi:hypothetical protein
VQKGDWVAVGVAGALRGGVVSLAIVPQSEQVASYYAGDDGAERAPWLVLER